MENRKLCVLFMSVCLLSLAGSCDSTQNRIKHEIKHLVGKKLNLDFDVIEVTSDTIRTIKMNSSDYRIVNFISKVECSPCAMRLIPILNNIADTMRLQATTNVIVITDSNDSLLIQKRLKELNLNNSVYLDYSNKYINMNNLQNLLARNRTFLINSDNIILVVGEPHTNMKIRELYFNAIK